MSDRIRFFHGSPDRSVPRSSSVRFFILVYRAVDKNFRFRGYCCCGCRFLFRTLFPSPVGALLRSLPPEIAFDPNRPRQQCTATLRAIKQYLQPAGPFNDRGQSVEFVVACSDANDFRVFFRVSNRSFVCRNKRPPPDGSRQRYRQRFTRRVPGIRATNFRDREERRWRNVHLKNALVNSLPL